MNVYNSLSDLLRETVGYGVFDLVPYVAQLDSSLLDTLNEPVGGLYLPGNVEPLFMEGETYWVAKRHERIAVSYDVILKDTLASKTPSQERILPPGELQNKDGEPVIKRLLYERIKHRLGVYPSVSIRGCEVAIAVVIDYLNTLCPYVNVPHRHYQLPALIKAAHHSLLEKQTFETALDDLVLDVIKFVGKDTWNIYQYKVSGTTLVLEKGLDFRIVDWHMNQITGNEHYDHDRGEVPDGYRPSSLRSYKRRW